MDSLTREDSHGGQDEKQEDRGIRKRVPGLQRTMALPQGHGNRPDDRTQTPADRSHRHGEKRGARPLPGEGRRMGTGRKTPQQGRPENRGLLRTVDGGAPGGHQSHHMAQRIQLDAHHERDHRRHTPQPAHRQRHQRNVQETAPHTQKQDRQHLSRSPRRHAPNRETGRTHRRRSDGKRRTNAGGPVRTPHPRRRRPSEGDRGGARRARSGGRRVRQPGRA